MSLMTMCACVRALVSNSAHHNLESAVSNAPGFCGASAPEAHTRCLRIAEKRPPPTLLPFRRDRGTIRAVNAG